MKSRFGRLIMLVVSFGVISLFSVKSLALTNGFQAISLYPATDGGPYVGIWGSKNLDSLQWELGTLAVYAYRPFQMIQNGSRVRGVLDNTIVQHFYGQLGIVDRWLSLGFDLPMGWWADFRDPNVAAATNQNKVVVGDVKINLKSELLRNDHFGIAIVPFMTIPTGYGREFFGNGSVTGGGTVVVEARPIERLSFSLNAGVQARKEFVFRDMNVNSRLELGLGAAVQIAKPISIVAEIASTTRLSDPFSEKVESPTEARGALKWKISNTGLLASLGGTGGIVRGSGAPTYSVFAGLSFSPARREKKERIVKEGLDLSAYTIYFETDSYSIDEQKEASKLYELSDKVRDSDVNLKVVGYTDSSGAERVNERLSLNRAEKAGWLLEMLGVSPSRMTLEGKGDADPVGNNDTAEGRAKNRRVEFDVVK